MSLGLLNEDIIYADCCKTYWGIVKDVAKEYFRIKLSKSEFANDRFHINVIVIFYFACLQFLQKKGGGGYAKHRLSKFLYLQSVRKVKLR